MKWLGVWAMVTMLLATGCSQSLFSGRDLTGWAELGSTGSWSAQDGVLKCNGQKDGYAWLSTDKKYGDFALTLEWRVPKNGNSGIFMRAPDREGRTSMKGFEIQIKDDAADEDLSDVSGAVFSRIPAGGKYAKPIGQWNRYKITIEGRNLTIELNGHIVSETDIDTIDSMKSIPHEGYIGLQNHGQKVEYRKIRIKPLN